uniref:Uncharacterized protein n=1 Tax=Arion vulgaris TaxID=1028688 RepID=A0A0B7BFD2_9EUPU
MTGSTISNLQLCKPGSNIACEGNQCSVVPIYFRELPQPSILKRPTIQSVHCNICMKNSTLSVFT